MGVRSARLLGHERAGLVFRGCAPKAQYRPDSHDEPVLRRRAIATVGRGRQIGGDEVQQASAR